MRGLLFWGLLGGLFVLVLKILNDLDINKTVYNHTPGPCHHIKGIEYGSEDVVLLKNGTALITSGMYLPSMKERPGHKGRVFVFDANRPDSAAVELQIEFSKGFHGGNFHPSGVAAWESQAEILVYCVDSYSPSIVVFKLDLNKKSLSFVKNIQDKLLTNPNNLVLVGKEKFYVSNFLYFNNVNPLLLHAELSLQLSLGSLLFYDGAKFHVAATNLKGPNGVAVSLDNKYLYVSVNMAEKLQVYQILPSMALQLLKEIPLYTGVDNINVDSSGHLWIGAHPILYQMVLHLRDPQYYNSPSQILKVTFLTKDHSEHKVEEILADDGNMIKASTAAAAWKKGFIVGTILDRPAWCDLLIAE